MATFLKIDGSMMEGGGQILRTAAALSCVLGQPIHIDNIRAGRSVGGIRPQHAAGLRLIREICQGNLTGNEVKSMEIKMKPGQIRAENLLCDTGTAGSVCLLLQAALPCLLFADKPCELTLRGGTNADMAPPIDYFPEVFGRIAKKFGVEFECNINTRGYYPKGGGEVVVKTIPVKHLKCVELSDAGRVVRVKGRAYVAGMVPLKEADSMVRGAKRALSSYCASDIHVDIKAVKEQSAVGNGSGITLTAETDTGMVYGHFNPARKGVSAEETGASAAKNLLVDLRQGGCVDTHLQDQLILFMALAKGKSVMCCGKITLHTETAIFVTERLTKVKFQVEQMSEDVTRISCEGIGLENKYLG